MGSNPTLSASFIALSIYRSIDLSIDGFADVETLAARSHDDEVFVHMGGTLSKAQELGVIKGGGIHDKTVDIDGKLLIRGQKGLKVLQVAR